MFFKKRINYLKAINMFVKDFFYAWRNVRLSPTGNLFTKEKQKVMMYFLSSLYKDRIKYYLAKFIFYATFKPGYGAYCTVVTRGMFVELNKFYVSTININTYANLSILKKSSCRRCRRRRRRRHRRCHWKWAAELRKN